MQKSILLFSILALAFEATCQVPETIQLNSPDLNRGLPVMKALSQRTSVKEFDTTSLKLQDISDLLWTANGINRPESGKRTAPSALNAQDIDIYTFFKTGVYLYNPSKNILELVVKGDYRDLIAGRQKEVAQAPFICLLISDISRFKFGDENQRLVWAANDAGIVSQNINIFCASVDLVTRPRSSMDQRKLRELLKLSGSQHLMLNNPVANK